MKKAAIRTLLFVGRLLIFILIWALAEPYFVNLEEEGASIPNLPEEGEGEQITAIGDFQIGRWLANDSTVREIAEQLVDIKPRAVLFLGDYIYHPVESQLIERQRVVDLIGPLIEADISIFAVLGNHDYAMVAAGADPKEVTAQQIAYVLEERSITVLQNEAPSSH